LFLSLFWIVIGIGAVRWFVWSGGRGGIERERKREREREREKERGREREIFFVVVGVEVWVGVWCGLAMMSSRIPSLARPPAHLRRLDCDQDWGRSGVCRGPDRCFSSSRL
jgi:hypothetical protein